MQYAILCHHDEKVTCACSIEDAAVTQSRGALL
jgi:hypothetical protein